MRVKALKLGDEENWVTKQQAQVRGYVTNLEMNGLTISVATAKGSIKIVTRF